VQPFKSARIPLTSGKVYFGDVVYYNYGYDLLIDDQSRFIKRHKFSEDVFEFIDRFVKTTFLQNKTHYMIIFTEGEFTHLDYIEFTDTHKELLNNKGLDIYIWETPNLGRTKDIVWKNQNNKDVYVIKDDSTYKDLAGFSYGTKLHCYETQVIDKFIEKNGLTNTRVYTGLYNFSHTKDLNLSTQCNPTDKTDVFFCEYNINETFDNSIETNMLCLNKRYDVFRELVCAHLLDKNCKFSYIPANTDLIIEENNKQKPLKKVKKYWNDINFRAWEDLSYLYNTHTDIKQRIKRLNKQKYFIDSVEDTIDWVDTQPQPTKLVKSSFCSIVNECEFAWPYAHISEKVLMPIKVFRPFVLVAPPYSLEYMHKLGFKTFDKWFDESYDKETDHVKRLSQIFDLIDNINNYSYNECEELLNDMKNVLEHNFNNLKYVLKQEGI